MFHRITSHVKHKLISYNIVNKLHSKWTEKKTALCYNMNTVNFLYTKI